MQFRLLQQCLLCSMIVGCFSYKFLLYMPLFGRSHVNFLGNLVDILLDAGHDVTILAPKFDPNLGSNGTSHPKAKFLFVPQCPEAAEMLEYFEKEGGGTHDMWRAQNSMVMLKVMLKTKHSFIEQCRATLLHPGLIEQLKAEKFDVGFAEMIDNCGVGIFELAGIEKTAITWSIAAFESGFGITGAPHVPSYVPGMAAKHNDQMSFMDRFYSLFAISLGKLLVPMIVNPYNEVFQSAISPNFPDMFSLYKKTSLVFLNTEPLIDFPRPTTHKIVEIGGISVTKGHKTLNQTWEETLSLRPKTVLLSFGTIAKAHLMPDEYKETIRETFRRFPDVTFIWKYEKPEDDIGKGIDNLIPATWVPQNDMLYDARLSLFITHGGQGSTTEASLAGVPLIVIPVAGDQYRNAHVLVRNKAAIMVEKEELAHTGPLERAIQTVLYDNRYREAAQRTSSMIANRPFSPKETFIRQMEFLARFGPLRNLDHYGVHLNFFQYYCLDVIALVLLVITLVLYISYRVIRVCFRCLCSSKKAKVE